MFLISSIQTLFQLRTAFVLIILWVVVSLPLSELTAQDEWDWRDPNDFGLVDLGDNKLLAYNMIGMGLSMIFTESSSMDSTGHTSIELGYLGEYDRLPLSRILLFGGRKKWPLRRFLDLEGGVRSYLVRGADTNTLGLGTFVSFTWNIIQSDQFILSYDNGVGPNYFFQSFPSNGTKFNFTTHYGLQCSFKANTVWIDLRFINYHISNADIKGRERNPALDSMGIEVSVSF